LLTRASFSLTTFSPSGKLVQIEHALAAVAGGTTSLGIKGASRNNEAVQQSLGITEFGLSPSSY
jgi:hypothetical protein